MCAVCLSGCLTTEYQARDWFGEGYSESRIGETAYRVDFQCNDSTPESVCEGYLFRRCAELTRNAGYDYFVMEDHGTSIHVKDTVVPGHYNTYTTGSGRDKTTSYVFQPGYVLQDRYPVSYAAITMHRGRKPVNARNTYAPDEILRYVPTAK
ncbi:MAG: hypothetical protein ABFD12_10790 [Syntrophorhabdus sp.]